MNWADTPLWLRALLGVAGLAAGMGLHLRLHPRRRQFSEAFDLLKCRPHLLLAGGLLLWLHRWVGTDGFHALPDPQAVDWADWTALALPLATEAALQWLLHLHQVLPAWPAALLLPAALLVALFHLARQPYRAGLRQRPRAGALAGLALLALLLVTVTAIEKGLPTLVLSEWQVNLFLVARLAALAVMGAGLQIWVLRVVRRWQQPPPVRPSSKLASNAWWEMLARWPLVLGLGAFNSLAVALRSWVTLAPPSPLLPWLLAEWLLLFAALPAAVALAPPGRSFFRAGGEALRLLGSSLLPLLGVGSTSVVILALATYADGIAATWPVASPSLRLALDAASAFALAFIRIWLFLAAALTLFSHASPSTPDPTPPPRQPE